MSQENKTSENADPERPDWNAIAAGAELKVNEAIQQLCELLTTKNRRELLARVATYILFSKGSQAAGKEHAQKSEVNLEYLCSLATALPDSLEADLPSADDVQRAIDLLATIHTHVSVALTALINSSQPEVEALAELSKSFQLQKLHVRGDGYWHHLKQTWNDLMIPHSKALHKAVGFDFSDYLALAEGFEKLITDRINREADHKHPPYRHLLKPWMDELQSGNPLSEECQNFLDAHHEEIEAAKADFDSFGSAESFIVKPTTVQENHILKSFSCGFGDNAVFDGNKGRFRFWPLNETVTDQKPFIHHQGDFYAFNFSKVGRSACEIMSNALRDTNPKYWESTFRPARDDYLEEETVRLFRKAFPYAQILAAGFYPLKAGGKAETDIIVVMDNALLVVECKAGSITPPAKRGGQLRVKTDVKKTIVEGLNQAERLISELLASGELIVQNKKSEKVILKAADLRWLFRINVTLDLISSVASNISSLADIGLVDSTDRCWSVSLNDLRVVVEILDRPAVFLHYLIRRFDTNTIRNVEAADELDYMMYYVLQGLFFRGKNKLKENEHLTIIGYTADLDQYYRRKQGLIDTGPKPCVALGPQTERFFDLLEKWRPNGWITAALHFLEFDRPDREELLGKTQSQLKRIRERRSWFALSVTGCPETKTAIALACTPNPEKGTDLLRAKFISRCRDSGFDTMVGIIVGIPVAAYAPIILCVSPNDSASDHAKRLLAQMRFEVTEHKPKKSRPGIFDSIRQEEE